MIGPEWAFRPIALRFRAQDLTNDQDSRSA
jgi:hypothetical protein